MGNSDLPQENDKHISIFLKNFFNSFSSDHITLGEIKDKLSDRAFGILMLLFALPNLVPLPIPGISTLLGTPLIILSYQLMMGRAAPWFPKWLAKRSLNRIKMEKVILYILPYVQKIERVLKPRLSFLVSVSMERFIAAVCLLMAVIMTLPIPLGNWFPALTICLFSLAILERDGIIVLLGLVAAIKSVALISTIITAVFKTILFFINKII